MTHFTSIKPGWPLAAMTIAMSMALTACSGDEGQESRVDAELIILQPDQSPSDVITGGNSNNNGDDDDLVEDVVITNNPDTSGQPLFANPNDTEQTLSGFEFCCGQYDTYAEHGFTDVIGDFVMLDGGWWGADVAGHLGERVFSSFGDGFNADDEALGWIGDGATGSMDSPVFDITEPYINFLIGGGSNGVTEANTTAIALVIDDQMVLQASGDNTPMSVSWQSWDVSAYVGSAARIRFIDNHANDNSDTALPYLLVDEIRQSDEAAAMPDSASVIVADATISVDPVSEGISAFSRVSNPDQNIAGFEFCCGQFNTYANHDFRATGDMDKLDGGWWAADITNHVGDRVFSSRGEGFLADGTGVGWIGDAATGTLSSPPFEITHDYVNFLIGGGSNPIESEQTTAAVLRVNGKIVRQAVGNGLESQVDWHSWDVSSLIGQTAVLEIIDHHDGAEDGSLAFIMMDEIRQADYAAAAPSADDIVTMSEGHDIELPLVMADPNPYFHNGEYYVYYLIDTAYHDWYLTKTANLLDGSFPHRALEATGDAATQDQWTGSGSVIEDADGVTHIFYSGHNADFTPVEAVMHATASDATLSDFTKIPEDTFSGTDGYSDFDFRDPKVFWNEDTGNYWMLITSRYNGEAAIGLYTSDDLLSWTPQAPLFTGSSSLNYEVPDWVSIDGNDFILYSDQADEARDMKYLSEQSGSWALPANATIDGKFYYAGRAATSGEDTLLFGWIPHKLTRTNTGVGTFGGDLAIHQLTVTEDGQLAVSMPDRYKNAVSESMSVELTSQSGSVSGTDTLTMMADSSVALAAETSKNRLSFTAQSEGSEGRFGLVFTASDSEEIVARLELDSNSNLASFYFGDTPPTGGASVTSTPALEGEPLFVRASDAEQHIAGFEFCCGQNGTLEAHEFTNVTGDFAKLDGGWWGGDVANNFGERVFSSFGDGFEEDGTALGWIGFAATGSVDSPAFEINKPYINFMIGGGTNAYDATNATAVVLIVDGEVVRSQSGTDAAKNADDKYVLEWVTWDVSDFMGQTAVVRFIDQHPDDGSDSALPYLLADQFRAADLPAVSEDEVVETGTMDAQVTVPMNLQNGVTVDIWMDPEAGVGSAYINDFRALSFRLYDLENRTVGMYSRDVTIVVNDIQRFKRTN